MPWWVTCEVSENERRMKALNVVQSVPPLLKLWLSLFACFTREK